MTPEGKVKIAVRKVLARFEPLYQFWPVPGGFGPSTIDCLVCFCGHFIGIETKAPGKKPTSRQDWIIRRILESGGVVFVIDNEAGMQPLIDHLESLHASAG